MLTSDKDAFNGRLTCTYDRGIRLCGYWEVALINLNTSDDVVYALCDLIDYSFVNNKKVQLLDCFSQKSHHPHYTKLANKRFSTINVDLKKSLTSDTPPNFKDNISCVLHFRRSPFL